jgi:hypothetical protein
LANYVAQFAKLFIHSEQVNLMQMKGKVVK